MTDFSQFRMQSRASLHLNMDLARSLQLGTTGPSSLHHFYCLSFWLIAHSLLLPA